MPAPKGNKNALGNKGGKGRPRIYEPNIIPLVKRLVARGATTWEIAEALGVSQSTLRHWKWKHIELNRAFDISESDMIPRSKRSLFERAVGYTFESEKVFQYQGSIIRAKINEHVPPDPTAALKILERLEPDTWRDRSEVRAEVDITQIIRASLKLEPAAPPAYLGHVHSPEEHFAEQRGEDDEQ